jgi:predicted dehydrogenase
MKRIGVLGFGRRIEHVLRNVVRLADKEIEVVAAHDTSPVAIQRASSAVPSLQVCASVDELVGREDLDWVFIGSFNAAHHDHAVAAMRAGKHVFCEKPLATTLEDCLDMATVHHQHPGREFVVGFVLRYSAFYRTMKQWIDEGRLGDLISMEFNETLAPFHGAAMHGNWRRHTKWSGPMILEKCCHDMDLMLWLTNSRPARVASFGGLNFFDSKHAHYNELYPVGDKGYRYYDRGLATGFAVGTEKNIAPFNDDKDTVDNQVAIMELENGARVSFHFCMHAAQLERRFYMCGTRGTIRGDVLTGQLEYTPAGWETKSEVVRPIAGNDHGNAEEPMASDIVNCMLRGQPMPTTLDDGLMSALTCFGLEEARATGTVVDMSRYWSRVKKA